MVGFERWKGKGVECEKSEKRMKLMNNGGKAR